MNASKTPAFELVLNRLINAPRARVFHAWSKPEHFPFTGTYRDIVPLSRLTWKGEFRNDPEGNVTTTVNFESQGQQTMVSVRQTFAVLTEQSAHATKGAKQGWTMTLDQLAEYAGIKEAV